MTLAACVQTRGCTIADVVALRRMPQCARLLEDSISLCHAPYYPCGSMRSGRSGVQIAGDVRMMYARRCDRPPPPACFESEKHSLRLTPRRPAFHE
jgi:hypothetical protein